MAARIPVSLSEILEVRSGGLDETEAWSVLHQGLIPLERLIENANSSSVIGTGLSPDSVFFLHDGSVQLKPVPCRALPESLLPPEYSQREQAAEDDLSKAYIYAFGAVVNYAMKWETAGSASSSPDLYSVLNLMTLQQPSSRLPLAKIAQIVQNQLRDRRIDAVTGIQGLYRLIMGSNEDVTDLGPFIDVTPTQPSLLVVDTAISPMSPLSAADPITSEPEIEMWYNETEEKRIDGDGSFESDSVSIDQSFKDDPPKMARASDDLDNAPELQVPLKYEDGYGALHEIQPITTILCDGDFTREESADESGQISTPFVENVDSTVPRNYGRNDDEIEMEDLESPTALPESKESELFLMMEFETPPAHSTAIANSSIVDKTEAKSGPFDLSPVEDSDGGSKQLWVSFEGGSTPKLDKRKAPIEPDLLWLDNDKSQDKTEETYSDFTTESTQRTDAFRPDSSTGFPLESDEHPEPFFVQHTFYQDPFSFYNDSAGAKMEHVENLDFQMAFPSDPTSPEKTSRSARLGPSVLAEDTAAMEFTSKITSGKPEILERLMPTASATFTHPKEHGVLERVRSFHSVDCSFCSPQRKMAEKLQKGTNKRRSAEELTVSVVNVPGGKRTMEMSDEEEIREGRKDFVTGLPLLSPSRDRDSLFASFDNLSSTATDKSMTDEAKTSDSSQRNSQQSPIQESTVLHYEDDSNITAQPVSADPPDPVTVVEMEDGAQFAEESCSSAPSVAPVVPPRRPPRKFDVSIVEKAPEENRVQKVELYTRKSSASQEKSPVPVLGVQQALAMQRRHEHTASTSTIDGQQPSTSYSGIVQPVNHTTAQVSNINTATGQESVAAEDRLRKTTSSGSVGIYRNPNFVRDSFSRSARRQPSLTLRQKSSNRQQSPVSDRNGASMAMNGTGPEFLYKSRLPSIRLKAPSAKRKKLFRSSPDAIVLVILLNGQRVDVECHVDSTAEDVFQAVSTHTNVMESHFFGLTYIRDGEHFFLEPEQKLGKYAPAGWRTGNNSRDISHSRHTYTLYFRLKFYPVSLDFVKTEQTLHQIYLQLRRDVIDERLQLNRESIYVLAAIALQAEYGDRPSDSLNYFQTEYYLPDPSTIEGVNGEHRVRALLTELHGQYAGLRKAEAEMEYVRTCQSAREYGIHFHRIYRTKPSSLLTPSPLGDPDTGTPLWIGIMPRGVVIFEERGGERVAVSQHPWQLTQTLQFDHKRFVIVPQISDANDTDASRRLIFFTDNYRKSCYFVHFAAAQHRFCMRMRFWASTLPMDEATAARATSSLDRTAGCSAAKNAGGRLQVPSNVDSTMSNRSSETDSGISREASPEGREVCVDGEVHRERSVDAVLAPTRTPLTPRAQLRSGALGGGIIGPAGGPSFQSSPVDAGKIDVSIPSHDASGIINFDETFTESMGKRLENATSEPPAMSPSDYETFSVKLYKDQQTGLGLTLVDGEIQGLKGVYVKSLTPGGPAELEGRLRTGDKIVSINGYDLDTKTRHDAVQLVRSAVGEVEIGILRLKSLYSSNESIGSGENASGEVGRSPHRSPERKLHEKPALIFDETKLSNSGSNSFSFKITGETKQTGKPSRQSSKMDDPVDFGKFGVLDMEEFLEKDYRAGGVRFTPDHRQQMYGGLNCDSEEDEDKSETGFSERSGSVREPVRTVSRNRPHRGSGAMRNASSDDEADLASAEHRTFGDGSYLKIDKKASKSQGDLVSEMKTLETMGHQHSGIDWTNDLMNSKESSLDSIDDQPTEDLQLINVELVKNEHGSLGIQVAGGKGAKKVYVKALVAEPALSCADILPGDQLASVNGVSTISMNHSDVVALLKNAMSPVQLGLLRPKSLTSNGKHSTTNIQENAAVEAGKITETLEVTLEKPSSGSLGLSLAKPRSGDGIYIRHINPNTVAALDGRLKEGDRLWKINGELVAHSTPEEVVEKLKAAQGYVHLVIRREVVGQ